MMVDCSDVRAALLDGVEPFEPRLQAHVAECAVCAELLAHGGALGHLLAAAHYANPRVAEGDLALAVARDLRHDHHWLGRLRGLSTSQRIALASVVALVPVLLLAVENPGRALAPERLATVAYGVALVVAIASLLAPLSGLRRAVHQAWIAAFVLGIRSLLLVMVGSSTAPATNSNWGCFATGMLSSAPGVVLLCLISRRPRLQFVELALLGGISGLIASMALQLHCIDTRMEHLVNAHGFIALVWIACIAVVLHRMEQRTSS